MTVFIFYFNQSFSFTLQTLFPRLLYVPFAIAFSFNLRFFFLILDLVLPIHFDRLCQIKS